MHIRRDYSQPFFREKKAGLPWRRLFFFFFLLIALAVYLSTQPALMLNVSYALLGNAPTPTPLPREQAEQAVQAYLRGDMTNALAFFEQAIAQRPENIDYLYEYAQLLIDENRADEALEVGQKIASLAPDDPRGYTIRARALVWLGQSASAIPIALSAVERNREFGAGYEALARAYAGEARWRDALDAGLMATEKSPSDVRAYWAYANILTRVASYDQAISELETAISRHPFFLPPYFELAFLLLSLDRNQEAIDLYDRILGIQPRNARALLRQCEAYRKVGEFERALGLCQDSVTADPTFAPAQYRLGSLRYSRMEFEQSQQAFEACITLEPDNLPCRYLLGLSHYYLGDCDNAWTLLQESLRTAQLLTDTDRDIDIIREGLTAISNDARCAIYRGRFSTPTPQAEATAEATVSP